MEKNNDDEMETGSIQGLIGIVTNIKVLDSRYR